MSTPSGDSIGERLGSLRRWRGFTQEQLAEQSGVDVSTVRKLEQGVRHGARLATLHTLARVLAVRTSELLGSGGAPAPVQDESNAVDLIRLREALAPIGEPAVAGREEAPDLEWLRRSYEAAYSRYERNEYEVNRGAHVGQPESLPSRCGQSLHRAAQLWLDIGAASVASHEYRTSGPQRALRELDRGPDRGNGAR